MPGHRNKQESEQLLDAIERFSETHLSAHNRFPSGREIAAEFDLSTAMAAYYLRKLLQLRDERGPGKIEIKRLNRQLKPKGQRICPCCGANHPLTEDYWYRKRNNRHGRVYVTWKTNCKRCTSADNSRSIMRRYRSDPVYRQHHEELRLAWRKANSERWHAYNRRYMRQWHLQRKQKRLLAIRASRTGWRNQGR